MKVRTAEQKDLLAIDAIYNQAIAMQATCDTEPLTPESRKDWFVQHPPDRFPIFVAEIDGIVAGWLSFSPYRAGRNALKRTVEVSYYIHSDFRRKGVGSGLIEFAIKKAREYDFKNLFAILLEDNTASIGLLEKFKFTRWGQMPNVAEFDGKPCGQLYYGLNL